MIATLTTIALWWSSLVGLVVFDPPQADISASALAGNEVDPPASAGSTSTVMALTRRLRLFPILSTIEDQDDSDKAGRAVGASFKAVPDRVPPPLLMAVRPLPPEILPPRYPDRSRALLL